MIVPEGRLKRGYCGPASLRIAGDNLGVPTDEGRLAEKIYDPEWGTSGDAMMEGVAMMGLVGMWKQGANLTSLSNMVKTGDYQVILNYMDGEDTKTDGHYSVLLDADKENVILADPEWIGSIKIMNRKKFEGVWFDLDTEGNVESKWALVISK